MGDRTNKHKIEKAKMIKNGESGDGIEFLKVELDRVSKESKKFDSLTTKSANQIDEIEIRERIANELPLYIICNGVEYKGSFSLLLHSGIKMVYAEYDGESFNWDKQLLNKVAGNRDLDIDSIIQVMKLTLNEYNYTILDEIVTKETRFRRELISLINRYSKESISNTPDFILADHMIESVRVLDHGIRRREEWYGRNLDNTTPTEVGER